MITAGTFVRFAGWHLSHPLEIMFLPKWILEHKKSTLQTELPWSNYHFIKFLEEKLSKKIDVLEFGSGGSTLFFSKRVKSITSIEHDKKWAGEVRKLAGANCRVLLKSRQKYLDITGKYDVIFIDGIRRLDCAKKSLSLVKKGGMIIVDDTNFPDKGIDACKFLDSKGFECISFKGIKSNDFNIWETKVYFC